MTIDRAITDYYNTAPEETRLQQGAFQLEAVRTRELIERHAPLPPARILDVGGAAGVYAFWLAERGYTVHLLDAVPRLVDEARRRNETATTQLATCQVGDAREIPIKSGSIDVVLMLGPLYHLTTLEDRNMALREAARVLTSGGVLLAAAISRYASVLDGLSRDRLNDPEFQKIVDRDLRDGQHRNTTGRVDYFTTAYFHTASDLRAEVQEAAMEVLGLYGIEGPAWLLADFAERWSDPGRRETILRVARLVEETPEVIGCSAHLLIAARK